MVTLLLRLQSPMQSWGISSHFTERDTGREPSKSGVIGLICSAMGRPRDADLTDLSGLRMGVRVDKEGVLQKDFQVAQNIMQADGKKVRENPEISTRYYLADAVFLVGLEGNEAFLTTIHQALKDPHWLVYLGRKAFPPGKPVYLPDGLINKGLESALKEYPALIKTENSFVRMVLEDPLGEFVRNDVPLNFKERRFTSRRIHIETIKMPAIREV